MGRIQQVTSEYRQRLMQHETTAVTSLNSAHKHTLAGIQPHLEKIYTQMEEAHASGNPVSLNWLYDMHRLTVVKALISGHINQYGAMAKSAVYGLKKIGVQLGERSALEQLNATKPMEISYSFGVPSDHALASIVGSTQAGSPLADLFDGFGAEAAEEAAHALITGVTLGDNPRKIAIEIEDALDVSRVRALTIARTECLRSYRMGNLLTMRQNDDVVSKWRWTCDKSARTCAACLAMDGTLHDLDEEMGSHPNCRCSPSPVTRSWSDILGVDIPETRLNIQTGEDWFGNQSEDVQRAILGNKFDAWSNGDFSLSDVVGHSHDADWGHSVYEKSLKQLKGTN